MREFSLKARQIGQAARSAALGAASKAAHGAHRCMNALVMGCARSGILDGDRFKAWHDRSIRVLIAGIDLGNDARQSSFESWKAKAGYPRPGWAGRAELSEALKRNVEALTSDPAFPWTDPACEADLRAAARAIARACAWREPGATDIGVAIMARGVLERAAEAGGLFEEAFRLELEAAAPGWHEQEPPDHPTVAALHRTGSSAARTRAARDGQRAFLEARALSSSIGAAASASAGSQGADPEAPPRRPRL